MDSKDYQAILTVRIDALKESKLPEADKNGVASHRNIAGNVRTEVLIGLLMEQKRLQAIFGNERITYLDWVKPSIFEIVREAWRRSLSIRRGINRGQIYTKAYYKKSFLPSVRTRLFSVTDLYPDNQKMPLVTLQKRLGRLVEKLDEISSPVKLGIVSFIPKTQ